MIEIALLQTNIKYCEPEQNYKRVRELFAEAMMKEPRPDIVVLPEDWSTGFSVEMFHNIEQYLEPPDGPSVTVLQELARRYDVWVCGGSVSTRFEDGRRSTSFFINRKGEVVGDFSKMHLCSDGDEDLAFLHGEKTEVFDTELGKLAFMICYDIRFPELSTLYALKGAELIIVMANFPNPRLDHWRTLLRARAIENQMFVAACNRVGESPMGTYCGHSMIINPWGEVIAEGGDMEEEIVSASIDLSEEKAVREMIHKFRDRRPQNCYK